MKQLLFSALIILVAAVGCTCQTTTTTGNQSPTAYIDTISPMDTSLEEPVSFDGHGTDTDGTVVGYQWRSSIDGNLSATASFKTSSLSVGNHMIYLSAG